MRDFAKGVVARICAGGIRRRLLMWGLGLFAITLTVVVGASYFYVTKHIERGAAERQREIAVVTAERIRDFVQRKIDRFSDTASAISLYPLGSKEQQLLASLLAKNDTSITDVSIIDAQGMEVLKVSDRRVYFPSDLTDQHNSVKFEEAIKGEEYISPVFTSVRDQPYVTLAIPLWGAEQRTVGVVSADADLSFLWEVIGKIHFGSAGYGYLVDQDGNLIAHKDGSLVQKKINLGRLDKVREFLRNPTRSDQNPAQNGQGLMDKAVLATYAPIPSLGWAVILEEPIDAALADVERLKRSAVVFLITGLLVGVAIIAWVSGKITRPIQELRHDVATIGAGNLEHRAQITTGDEIEELAAEFNKMTAALQNSYATLEQKVDQRTKEMSALYSVTTAVNESLALEDILNAVIPKTTDIFRFDTIRVFLFNDEGDELQLRASFAIDSEYVTRVRALKRGQGVIGRVAETGEPMIFQDIRSDPRYAELSTTKATLKANLAFLAVFPIKTQARVFGAILFGLRSPRQLSHDETQLLTSMSEHLAVAVEKAKLFRESETRAQQLSLLNTIGSAVSESLDLDMVLNAAINKTIEALNFDASWIYILDTSGDELALRAHKGLDQETVDTLVRREVLAGDTRKIFRSGKRLVFEDFQSEISHNHLRSRYKSFGEFASEAGFPIKTKDKVIGVLHLATRTRRHFAPDELKLIESIAQEIGVAVDNARLFEQVNQKTAELGRLNEELQQANRARDEFLSIMSHELRTPLNVINGYAEVLSKGILGEIEQEQLHAVKVIGYQSKELLRMINEILQVGSIEAGRVTARSEEVDISQLLTEVQSGYEILAKKNIPLYWNIPFTLPTVYTDKEKLKHVLQNLINNAIKFTEQGSVTISVRYFSRALQFEVKDTGIGIPEELLPSIFQMFRQLDSSTTRSYGGSGVGLYIVKKFIELLNGTIEVESVVGSGSTFTVTLPLNVIDKSLLDTSGDLRLHSSG